MSRRQVFDKVSVIPASAADVFAWHARAGAFERLNPPWEPVEVVSRDGSGLEEGSRVELRMPLGPISQRWVAEHRDFIPNQQFRDVQTTGPFAEWEHTHTMQADGPDACRLQDHIEYRLPLGSLGQWLGQGFARKKLERVFDYRHRVTVTDLLLHNKYPRETSMNILISGSTGLVGSSLVPFLTTGGHRVTRLVRPSSKSVPNSVTWNPREGQLESAQLAGHDAIVHLAGENIAGGRWTADMKRRIRESRVNGTRLLCERLASLPQPPRVLVSASAIGYYGDRSDEELSEISPRGTGFLPEVCAEWEAATEPARAAGIRVVLLRLGIVLSPAGGALAKMLTPFKLGAGGVLGNGKQWMSWVGLDDVIGAIHHALMNDAVAGPVNVTAPHPVTNREFTKVLGKVLSRPTIFPVPGFAARLAFGEMADALLLGSTRVIPHRLLATNYDFIYPELEGALRHLLGKPLPAKS